MGPPRTHVGKDSPGKWIGFPLYPGRAAKSYECAELCKYTETLCGGKESKAWKRKQCEFSSAGTLPSKWGGGLSDLPLVRCAFQIRHPQRDRGHSHSSESERATRGK